jgi:hypothetical protein
LGDRIKVADESEQIFYIGDGVADLVLLGIAATLAARYQSARKHGQGLTDADVTELVMSGIAEGISLPLDDVPEVRVAIHAPEEVMKRLLERAHVV